MSEPLDPSRQTAGETLKRFNRMIVGPYEIPAGVSTTMEETPAGEWMRAAEVLAEVARLQAALDSETLRADAFFSGREMAKAEREELRAALVETTAPPERPEQTCYGCGALHIPEHLRRDPTAGELQSPVFNAVWDVIKRVDVHYAGGLRSGATGNDVCAILALTGVAAAATPPDPQRPTFGHDPHVGEMTAECAPMYFRGKETEAWAAGYNRVPEPRTVKLGVIEFHSPSFNPGLMERFYAVTKDLTAAGCIVDLWLMDIATVLSEFGYTMTIATDRPAPTLAMPTPTLK